MFYSHQLLARKAPLGQIWMAATTHAKMNRQKLNKLNIIQICEEILNPSVPMALRLSGILMGGVVIVYERKVKLLYDDVTHLLVEINEAWKVKAALDSTVLPKGKLQAKKEAVTLPQVEGTDLEDVEQSRNCSNTINMGFRRTDYFAMTLDNVDETYVKYNPGKEEPPQNFHQADVDNITFSERFDSYQANAEMYDRFERFDIDEDMETQPNFTSGEHIQTAATSPPPPDEPQRADEIHDQHPENQFNQQSDESKEARQSRLRQGPLKRKTRRPATFVMDFEQTMIPGHTYQSWLQDTSDICSRRRKKKATTTILSTMKIAKLMELPPLVYEDLLKKGTQEIYYPAPLLELWTKQTLPHDSPSARTSLPQPPEPSVSPPSGGGQCQDPDKLPFEDIHSGVGSQSGDPIEYRRTHPAEEDFIVKQAEEMRNNIMNTNASKANEVNLMVAPGKSDDVIFSPSSVSGHGYSEINLSRSSQKGPINSSSRVSGAGLDPVFEESNPDFKLSRPSENGMTPDPEMVVETGQTQSQPPSIDPPFDKITDSIRMQMKSHFDTPGAPKVESFNNLAAGLTRKAAAILFYQTCVLASDDSLRVEQKVPYGDIFITRGAKM